MRVQRVLTKRIDFPYYEKKDLTEEAARKFLLWINSRDDVERFIIKEFESSIDDLVVRETYKLNLSIEDKLLFEISYTPRTKTPAYKDIFENLYSYLKNVYQDVRAGLKKQGVRKVNNEPYILLSIIEERIKEPIEECNNNYIKASKSLKLIKPEELVEIKFNESSFLEINLKRDYSLLNEANAKDYWIAKNFLKQGNKYAEKIKELIEKKSFEIIGINSKEELTTTEIVSYEDFGFEHKLIYQPRTEYGKIIQKLIKEPPKKITTKSKVGDFEIIKAKFNNPELFKKMKEKGIFNEELINIYKPLSQDSKIYIRVFGLKEMLDKYKKEFTKPSIRNEYSIIRI